MGLAMRSGDQPGVTDRISSAPTMPAQRVARHQGLPAPAARVARGRQAQRQGLTAEGWVAQALVQAGWHIHGRRLRTAAGEVDIVAERDGLLTLVEVKSRGDLRTAAAAISPRQQQRLLLAGAILQGENPHWGPRGMRFDAWFVAPEGQLRHVPDAFREMG